LREKSEALDVCEVVGKTEVVAPLCEAHIKVPIHEAEVDSVECLSNLRGIVIIPHGVRYHAHELERQSAVGWYILKEKRKQTNSIAQIIILGYTKLIKNNGASPFGTSDFTSLDLLEPVLLVVFF
jgi:hypothetical protein